MGRVGEQNKVSVSMLLLIHLKKKTIHDAVCNKIRAPHVIYPDARAAGKRFYIEASVRDIEKIFGMRPQRLNLQCMAPHWIPRKPSPWNQKDKLPNALKADMVTIAEAGRPSLSYPLNCPQSLSFLKVSVCAFFPLPSK
jgi:hypothetical protein